MPILDEHSLECFSRSPEQTKRLGVRLGSLLQCGDVVALSGDLGAGKTTLVQGMAQGWGSLDSVSSPTFVIVNSYRRADGMTLAHLDAYRLNSATEAEELDLDYLLESGALVAEWAEHIQGALPRDGLWIAMRWVADEHRNLLVRARGERYDSMLAEFRQMTYGVT